jgi:3'-phosphoadenosine 5'-phosphosulfate sulfotransferase (PAPS reductase)/FAD synthetase
MRPVKNKGGRVVCWFSAGAASAVATKLALADYTDNEVQIIYTDPGSEHPDNKRFIADCEDWFGQSVIVLKSEKFADTWDVWAKRRYTAGIAGAPCTMQLKKTLRQQYEDFDDIQVFGYTAEESGRADRFRKQNPEVMLDSPLIRHGVGKGDCLAMIERAGIALPVMYSLGFRNNNCIPCSTAGSAAYWRLIRTHFPAEFERYAALADELGVKQLVINDERRSLRDLDSAPAGNYVQEDIECSLFCHMAEDTIK